MIPRVVGAPARRDSFYNREELVKKLVQRLSIGSILLVAPRRFGKTSLMLKTKEELESKGKIALFLDVEWVSEPSDFVTEIICKLKENTSDTFSKWVRKIPNIVGSLSKNIDGLEIAGFRLKLRNELQENWIEKGRDIFWAFQELESEVVLFIDEFPLMIHNMLSQKKLEPTIIRKFLYWLRSMRIDTNIRMVLGGSIGIDYILKQLDANAAINDLERIRVGSFDPESAKKFISLLFNSEGFEIDSKTVEKILEILGVPIPYFIQVFVAAILSEIGNSHISPSAKLVEEVYRKKILGFECRTYFEHYFNRLSIYYSPDDANIAKKLLKDIALNDQMTAKELFKTYSMLTKSEDVERFNYLINDLENDFYIVFDERKKGYIFSTKILQDLWLRRYEVLE